jgi:hypothetical protein
MECFPTFLVRSAEQPDSFQRLVTFLANQERAKVFAFEQTDVYAFGIAVTNLGRYRELTLDESVPSQESKLMEKTAG